ncbi:hypothetical protein Q9Q99_03980 [Curtobacterium flaccumfaciens]|nr:hypothetical protein Q9Q99_03980 [Curtobacterium flaccumfaciens]
MSDVTTATNRYAGSVRPEGRPRGRHRVPARRDRRVRPRHHDR